MNDLPSVSGMPIVIEVDTVKAEDLPERAQQILCLRACGFSASSIARLCHVTPSAVTRYIQAHDPDGKVTLSRTERKKFLATLWEARGGEALLHMTPEKMEQSSASDLARIAGMAMKASESLQVVEQEKQRSPYDILRMLGPSAS